MNPTKLQDKVVIVTGASKGIGRAVVDAVLSRGARVGLIARPSQALDDTTAAVGDRGAAAPADVADPAALRAAITSLTEVLGPTDVLVANAGTGAFGPFADLDADLMHRLVAVNVLGTMHAVQAVIPGMIARRSGHIVILGSIAGRIGGPFEAAYSATKFATVGLAEALQVELSPYGVGVSLVNPGPTESEFFEARGHPYDRKHPKQVPTAAIAEAVVAAVERDFFEQYRPAFLRQAVLFRHLIPPLYRWGSRRTFRAELARDVANRTRTS